MKDTTFFLSPQVLVTGTQCVVTVPSASGTTLAALSLVPTDSSQQTRPVKIAQREVERRINI